MNNCIALFVKNATVFNNYIVISFDSNVSSNFVKVTAFDTTIDVLIADGSCNVSVHGKCANGDNIKKTYNVSWDVDLLGQDLIDSIVMLDTTTGDGCCPEYGDCMTNLVGLTDRTNCGDCPPYDDIPTEAFNSSSGYYLTDLLSFKDYFLTDCSGASNWTLINTKVKRVATQDLLNDISACMGQYQSVVSDGIYETAVGNANLSSVAYAAYNNKYSGHALHTKNNNGEQFYIDNITIIKPFILTSGVPFVGDAKIRFYVFKNNEVIATFYANGSFNGKNNAVIDVTDEKIAIKLDGSTYSIIWRTYDYNSEIELKPSNAVLQKMHDGFPCSCNVLPPSWICKSKSSMPADKCTYTKFVALGIRGDDLNEVKKWGMAAGQKANGFATTSGGIATVLTTTSADCSIESLICAAINDNRDIRNSIAYMLQRKMAIKAADLIMYGELPDSFFELDVKRLAGVSKIWVDEYTEKLNGYLKNKSICVLLKSYIGNNLCSACKECDSNALPRKTYSNI